MFSGDLSNLLKKKKNVIIIISIGCKKLEGQYGALWNMAIQETSHGDVQSN